MLFWLFLVFFSTSTRHILDWCSFFVFLYHSMCLLNEWMKEHISSNFFKFSIYTKYMIGCVCFKEYRDELNTIKFEHARSCASCSSRISHSYLYMKISHFMSFLLFKIHNLYVYTTMRCYDVIILWKNLI